ncbi:hypothetical protein [Desulfosudis oleivorans]|uniref:Uncharacterized protein n=1 Tax=Desulfosudis oleivorans (strain DSM 6200 / JCM 39069 / Hxd3) TaxID=96561 RepID=A8ZV86_DESOH|nr:hypothetical protein [Desulfosudis oleivorans]ABW66547.1 hypothetical protein Dole_0737 [Desulfosudis oleivorans Hxd3]
MNENRKSRADRVLTIQPGPGAASWRIAIVNASLVEDKYVNIVDLAAHICPAPPIRSFEFTDSPVYHTCISFDETTGEAVLFLRALFEKSCLRVQDPEQDCFSLRASFWLGYLTAIFRLFAVMCEKSENRIRADLNRFQSIMPNDPVTGKLLSFIGRYYNVEPPPLKKDRFLGPLVERQLAEWEAAGVPWAAAQREIMHKIGASLPQMGLFFLREYFQWTSGNLGNKDWPPIAPSFHADPAEMEAFWQDVLNLQRRQEKRDAEHKAMMRDLAVLNEFERQLAKKGWE